jgi:tRNA-splicing ligase RtcB
MQITGAIIKEFGYSPASWWKQAIGEARGREFEPGEARAFLDNFVTQVIVTPSAAGRRPWFANIEAEDDAERANIESVSRHMDELMRVPTIVAGAIMPDACPSDHRLGAIPVGGVAAAKEAIHPGMHSADICCSMAISVFGPGADPKAILDAGMKLSHFGGGGRPRGAQIKPPNWLMHGFAENAFLAPLQSMAIEHFATQGDGNHFFYVGRIASIGRVALVTHHGSRGPGAKLYSAGMGAAERTRRKISPDTPAHNAWIPSETEEGRTYWSALQIVREWTKGNHYAIHDLIAEAMGANIEDRFWNEHNFVFRRSDGLFYHAKGATPAYQGYAADASGWTLIPLNMAEPILITRGLDAANGLGFSPHGAGRNFSRSAYMRANVGRTEADMIAEQAPGIDVRYFCGIPDISELPMAYKNAASMRRQIDKFGLAEVVDTVEPIGNIMAGDWQRDAPWRKKKQKISPPAQ